MENGKKKKEFFFFKFFNRHIDFRYLLIHLLYYSNPPLQEKRKEKKDLNDKLEICMRLIMHPSLKKKKDNAALKINA